VATLADRIRRGERFWQGHRDHLYQRLTRAGLSHAQVSAFYFGLTLLAGGGACLAQANPDDGLWILLSLGGIYALFALCALGLIRARGKAGQERAEMRSAAQ
jgi:hypothetical protein